MPVICSSYGEAGHLSHEERFQSIIVARMALDENDMTDIPIIAGVSAASTRESINLALEAASAGADYVMAGVPGTYSESMNTASIGGYFVDVAAGSSIPLYVMFKISIRFLCSNCTTFFFLEFS
jgi:4-hydroxy-2-oxoglutarate aldolase